MSDIEFVVVGHHARRELAEQLAESLGAYLLVDEDDCGANWNHYRALQWAAEQSYRVVVLEDDALPVEGFQTMVTEWLTRFPDSLISFYLGTGRPPQYQLEIATSLSPLTAKGLTTSPCSAWCMLCATAYPRS